MDDITYCPILKGKLNDIKAASFLRPALATRTKPVFELPPFKPSDDVEKVLIRFAQRLSKNCGVRSCYIDFPMLRPGLRLATDELALSVAYGHLNALGVTFEPTYGFDRDPEGWAAVGRQTQRSGGLLLRLDRDDLDFQTETIEQVTALRTHGIRAEAIDVLIDHRYLQETTDTAGVAARTADFIDALVRRLPVRRVIVAGSSAPKTMAGIPHDSHKAVARNELALWAQVATARLPIAPIYSDYGVIHPEFSDLTPSPHINGKIRYTHGRAIHIHRGHSLQKDDRREQYRALASTVRQAPYYQGNTFSFGDRYIFDCATGQVSTGSPGTWVHVDQNHHMTYVAQQQLALLEALASGHNAELLLSEAELR